jgi:hypothetical protein
MPAGLQGEGGTASELLPVDPNLLTDFSATATWDKTDYTNHFYAYDLGGYHWLTGDAGDLITVNRKVLWAGLLWFGAVENALFVLENGTSRGTSLSMEEIAGDATDGAVRYDLEYSTSGNTAGGFVAYWNTTAYADPEDAWDNNVLYLLHGMGIDTTAAGNIFALLVALLFLQLPDVPVLVNLLIATPIWACIIYLIWYVVKESLPFL